MSKKNKNNSGFIWLLVLAVIFVIISLAVGPKIFAVSYDKDSGRPIQEENSEEDTEVVKEVSSHIALPNAVKAIYMTSCVVGTKDFRAKLVALAEETEVNAIVIDIKDFSGTLSFAPKSDRLKPAWDAAQCGTSDMKEFIAELHEKGIFVIGRITVFQDPFYTKLHPEDAVKRASDGAVWKDHKGLSFVEVGAKRYWDYILELSHESYEIGFDELNFDYVRFPSDGNMKDIYFPFSNEIIVANGTKGKQIALEEFFKFLDKELRGDLPADTSKRPIISADLFGMTTTNTDDLNIGQVLERSLPYFDYIAPMVYPSHYPNTFNGWANPNHYPYELIHFVMGEGVRRVEEFKNASTTPEHIRPKIHKEQLRTWIQDFDYGGDYGPTEVREQIQATYDVGLTSWMIWAPSNIYTRGALLNE
ncbi:MAG: putative glycoside hydrolase [Candidatus Paceibacterota bacterium]